MHNFASCQAEDRPEHEFSQLQGCLLGFLGLLDACSVLTLLGHACRESATRWQHAGEAVPADMRSCHQQGAYNLL